MNYDCQMCYRSLEWEEGQLVFTNLALFDSSFQVSMDKLRVRFDWSAFPKKMKGHLTVESPHLAIKDPRKILEMKGGWFDFSASVKWGILEWGGPVHFTLDYTPEKARLNLDWDDAEALVIFENGRTEISLLNFKLLLLKSWIPHVDVLNGAATGRLSFDKKPISANLQFHSVDLNLNESELCNLKGSLSYNANLGAKWEMQGMAKAQKKAFPFHCEGRGFFKSHWFESKFQFDDSWCTLSGEEFWNFESSKLNVEKLVFLQSGLAIFWPEVKRFQILEGAISGSAFWSLTSWGIRFDGEEICVQKEGRTFLCSKTKGALTHEGGAFSLKSDDYELDFEGEWKDWKGKARIKEISLELSGAIEREKAPIKIERGTFKDLEFQGEGWVDSHLDCFFSLKGKWDLFDRKIAFQCPVLSKTGDRWNFDFRFCRKTWDLFRFRGVYENGEIHYDEKSHFLDQPLCFTPSIKDGLDVHVQIPQRAIQSAGPFLSEWGLNLDGIPVIDCIDAHFRFKDGSIAVCAKSCSPQFSLDIVQAENEWKIDLDSEAHLHAILRNDGSFKGSGEWKTALKGEFEGKIDPTSHCELSFQKLFFDLSLIQDPRLSGTLEGGGHLIYNGEIETDLDFEVSSLAINGDSLENDGQIHLYYASNKGAMLRGVNLHGPYDCKIDLLEYDQSSSHWIFHSSQIHLKTSLLSSRFLQFLDQESDLNFTADLEFAPDFSTFTCTMREGVIPYAGKYHHVENLSLFYNGSRCKAALHYLNDLYKIDLQIDENIRGRLIVGEESIPLTIDWEYIDSIFIHSIEGSFGGIDASFHAESPNLLVGSASFDFTTLSKRLPIDVAQVFDEIKMGKGYELKGRLKIENNLPYFKGILSGKAIELFGFQFRTLLAQVDLGSEFMRIYDVKISDTAGVMKIDEIVLEGDPMTISIPNLTILELRPSLLQRPGKSAGPLSPLVVRELKMSDFKGLLDDGKTYTAKGKLHFINSYKRGETVFDLPVNMLSRIVGLDLELLIPVKGDLTFELKDGYFCLLELSNAFSEQDRSQFFLEMDPAPIMDLDGNLRIFIKMKQFVLLKITESFLISIEGKLDDPDFHLKKKKFFGLL